MVVQVLQNNAVLVRNSTGTSLVRTSAVTGSTCATARSTCGTGSGTYGNGTGTGLLRTSSGSDTALFRAASPTAAP